MRLVHGCLTGIMDQPLSTHCNKLPYTGGPQPAHSEGVEPVSTAFGKVLWAPNTAPANIAVLDRNGHICAVNDAWRRFASENNCRDENACIGDDYVAICRAAAGRDSEGAPEVAEALEKLLQGEISVFTIEYPCHAPWEERWFEMIAVRDPTSKLGEVLVMHHPITGRKQAEHALIEAKRAAEEAAAAKTRFLAAASHDLRQPVQAAMLFHHMLPVGMDDGRKNSVHGKLGHALEALQGMLDTLLDISKIDAGIIKPQVGRVPLAGLIERLVEEFTPLAEDRALALRAVPCSVDVTSDPHLLELILRNLLSNAIRFTEHGAILLGCRRHGNHVSIQVHDTGVGIPDQQLSLIFEEFYQVDNVGRDRRKGLGLGLAIVNRLACLLDHPISVRSAVGRGTAFEVSVPLAEAAAAAAAPCSASEGIAGENGSLIALIDDDPDVLDSLQMFVEQLGYGVVAAATAGQAVEELRRRHHAPDAIVADYRLEGGQTGSDAIRTLREAFGSGIPGILLTGDAAIFGNRIRQDDAFRFLAKPIRPDELERILGEALHPAT
jgi:two-component system CheB/CheR fusion protein